MGNIKVANFVFLFFIVLVLVFGGLLSHHFQDAQAQGAQYELSGWVWSDVYGWISLNMKNFQPECEATGNCLYGVTLDSGNNLSGYGWSSNVGWVCFGVTCDEAGIGGLIVPYDDNTQHGDDSYAQLNSNTGKIDGWANVLSLHNDGWIHFRRGGSAGPQKGEACYDCEPACERLTCQKCDESWENCGVVSQCINGGDGSCIVSGENCREIQPCIVYSEVKFESCKTCFSETRFDNNFIPITAIDPIAGGSGYTCSVCTGGGVGDSDAYCDKEDSLVGGASRVECSSCPSCELYGVNMDTQTGGLVGWGWGGQEASGWVHFNLISGLGGSYVVYPWLETQYGSIYTAENIRQRAGTSGKNATYCIFADSVERVESSDCESRVVSGVDIDFPAASGSGVYRNALGRIDVDGLTDRVTGNHNKYGQAVYDIEADGSGINSVLGGDVYYRNGDLTIGATVFSDGVSTGQSGHGTIVINGDLVISDNIVYQGDPGNLSNIEELASVAWIVKGDLIVNSNVTEIVGAFIVLGDGSACFYDDGESCDDIVRQYPQYKRTSYGVAFSVDPQIPGDTSKGLTVSGLMFARSYDLRRTFAEVTQGSERIIYDGRLIANPPPGLEGFSEGLPVIRDFLY